MDQLGNGTLRQRDGNRGAPWQSSEVARRGVVQERAAHGPSVEGAVGELVIEWVWSKKVRHVSRGRGIWLDTRTGSI